jgi:hypothetical protein
MGRHLVTRVRMANGYFKLKLDQVQKTLDLLKSTLQVKSFQHFFAFGATKFAYLK